MGQCIYRKIQQFSEIKSKYCEDSEFQLNLKQLSALALVPLPAVEGAFEILLKTEFFTKNEPLLRPLI